MRALWDWLVARWPPKWWPFRGGVQGDDDPDGWQAPVYDDDPDGER